MAVEIVDIPEDIIENILLRLSAQSLPSLSSVCRGWYDLILSTQFWIRKISFDGLSLPQSLVSNDKLDWRLYFLLAKHYSRYQKLSFGSNILQNGSGELETDQSVLSSGNRHEEDFDPAWFRSWTVLSSGGDGWRLFPVSATERYFATSTISCTKEQVICLEERGVSPRVMDLYQPDIEVEELYSKHPHHGASYELHVFLLDESQNVVGKPFMFRDNMSAEEEDQWREVRTTWADYGEGVRFIKFYHGGFAETMEAGWQGAIMTGATVTVTYPDCLKSTALINE